jgi:hypothetical protein
MREERGGLEKDERREGRVREPSLSTTWSFLHDFLLPQLVSMNFLENYAMKFFTL